MSRYDHIVSKLEAIGAELDDLALEVLHQAVADGAGRRPDDDKVLTQARRAIEKATHLLARLD